MAQIDKFIDAFLKQGGECLVLAGEDKASFRSKGVQRALTAEPINSNKVLTLLREVLPPALEAQLAECRNLEFPYESPRGVLQVRVNWNTGFPVVELTPKMSAQAAPSRAEGTAAAAASTGEAQGPSATTTNGGSGNGQTATDASQIEAMFQKLVSTDSSDLHLTSGSPPLFRKDGTLTLLGGKTPIPAEEMLNLLYPITPEDKRMEFERDNDTDFSYEINGLARFRCNLFRDRTGIGGVFRVIPSKIPSASALGLSQAVLDLCDLPKGLVIVTGPTGSGKSTTLASMIDYINSRKSAHLITIEDPIEFVHSNRRCLINQREIGSHTKGFRHALRAALREDPDILLVGEMRDLETISIALETAETGHLVFGTLHTNTAPSAVDRIIDQFPSEQQNQIRSMLAEVLKGVVAQTLCKSKRGGRVAAREILLVNSAVSNLIREGKTFQIPSIMQTGKGIGMKTLNDSLIELVKGGQVEASEALTKAVARTEFETQLQRLGVKVAAV